jgi:membrane protease YdiL (CAAX protease family)
MMSDYLQRVEWSIPQALFVFLGGLAGALVTTVGVLVVQGSEMNILAFSASFAGQAGGNLLVMWILSVRKGTGNLARDFGLKIEAKHWWGIPAGLGLQTVVALVTAPLLRVLFPDGPPQQSIATLTEGTATVFDGILIVVMVGIAAPIVEEMLFRGMLLSRFSRSMSPAWAILLQAIVFASIHLLDPSAIAALPGLLIVGAVLGYAAMRTGNLSLPIMIHAGVNLTAVGLLIFGGPVTDWLEKASDPAVIRMIGSVLG